MKKELSLAENKKRSLKVSIKEGCAANFSAGLSNFAATPFALKLSSKELNIGLLSAFSNLISPITQLYGSKLMDKYPRKKIVRTAVLWQAIMWLPLVILAILKYYALYESTLIYFFIVFYTIAIALGGIGFPSWFSWMGDLVPDKEKAKYFSKRNSILGIFEVLAVIIAAYILYISDNSTTLYLGFASIFFAAFIFRFISYSIFHKQYILYSSKIKKYDHNIKKIFKENKNFRFFSYYQLILSFSIFFASPFFGVYILNELKLNYIWYMTISLSGSIFYFLLSPIIGKFSQKYGNVKLFLIQNTFFAITPLLYVIIKSPILLAIFPGLTTGIANAAMILSFNNFSYDYLTKKERATGIAYSNVFAGFGAFIGSIVGGLLLNFNFSLGVFNKFISIFIFAFLLRVLVGMIFLPKIKEKKKVQRIPPMHISLTHPFKTVHAEIGWVKHIFK